MWRISDDFWDNWKPLKEQFARLNDWTPYRAPGHFPDADMLPLANVRAFQRNGQTKFTHDEQITLLTLWSIARSPLILGANLPNNDDFTLSLLTNDEILAVDQNSTNNRQLSRDGDFVIWTADVPNSTDKYVALFNAKDAPAGSGAGATEKVTLTLKYLGLGDAAVTDLWSHKNLGVFNGAFAADLPYHGAGMYRVSPN
jgi:hypothetical protein